MFATWVIPHPTHADVGDNEPFIGPRPPRGGQHPSRNEGGQTDNTGARGRSARGAEEVAARQGADSSVHATVCLLNCECAQRRS
ncbi:MAG: hypothetical protein BWX48_02244 [Verrucomicrobia bacterium ADurb.Bin006]|nr:MAG: hypothetical protein BWX48_02244 [Verrucomicrobia bacterium ADurb.Bin006]